MFGIAVVPSVLLALGMAISPESPRWLFQVFPFRLFGHMSVNELCSKAFVAGFSCQNLKCIIFCLYIPSLRFFFHQQGKIPQAEKAIRTLYGKERVAEVVTDLSSAGQGSTESDAGWFDLFSSRYWKGIRKIHGRVLVFNCKDMNAQFICLLNLSIIQLFNTGAQAIPPH